MLVEKDESERFDSRRLHHTFAELARFRGCSAQTLPNHDGSLQIEELDGLARDLRREVLEWLCRYGARPAFAKERLAWTADGRIAYKLKRPWPDGRTHLAMEPVAFLRRLCGIIPPPRRHLVRYSGIFGPASKDRHALRALVSTDRSHQAGDARCTEPRPSQTAGPASRARRLPWADLLRRVFADDVLQCPCGGRRSVVAIVTDSALARVLLAGFGLATEPSTFAPARAPPQADLPWDDAL